MFEDRTRTKNWKRWGPYLSERQWATVREDYSRYGNCWDYIPHDHARSRVYRWGEDGLLGFTDCECRLCFALALWNRNSCLRLASARCQPCIAIIHISFASVITSIKSTPSNFAYELLARILIGRSQSCRRRATCCGRLIAGRSLRLSPFTSYFPHSGHKKCSNRRRVSWSFASSERAPRVFANFS
jgi:hypothetical protein